MKNAPKMSSKLPHCQQNVLNCLPWPEALLELGEGLAPEAAEHLQVLEPGVIREGQVGHGQNLVAPRGAVSDEEDWF